MAARARFVRIDRERLERYAAELPLDQIRNLPLQAPKGRAARQSRAGSQQDVEFVLLLDAINFGSGYFPHLRKLPGLSGYQTIEARLGDWWEEEGPPSADALRRARPTWLARILGQTRDDPIAWELMRLFARAWQDLGALALARFAGDLAGPVRSSGGSGAALVLELCCMPFFRDLALYDGRVVPFLKRAQITVHDLALTAPGRLGSFRDLEELTLFADNLVPHVLRLDGVLRFSPGLVEKIERADLLAWGAPEEVEIRASAVHALEQLVARLRARGEKIAPRELDPWLWSRGHEPRFKARPRHRSRSVCY